jgi:hypothetical protein
MFGQDNDNKQAQTNSDSATAPPMPTNPFAESDAPVPPTEAPSQTAAAAPPALASVPDPTPLATSPAPADDLLNIKQQALQNLQPLVSHLEQPPEEKFKTTMMLIQASDNAALVKQAYEAASQITDEKARAQALLDVVNEINYFTHKDKE